MMLLDLSRRDNLSWQDLVGGWEHGRPVRYGPASRGVRLGHRGTSTRLSATVESCGTLGASSVRAAAGCTFYYDDGRSFTVQEDTSLLERQKYLALDG
jgi:hypothetical protein